MDHSTISATPVAPIKGTAFKRVLATAVTAALAFAGVTAVAAPASAAVTDTVTDGTVSWGFSTTSASWGIEATGNVDLIAPTVATDYTKSNGFTLTDGVGTIAPNGTGSLDFEGSVTYSPFAAYGTMTFHSTITLSDFELDIASATRGSLTADVTWVKEASSKTEPTRVTVANFDIASLTNEDGDFALTTAAPDWTGTVEAGKYSATYADAWPTSFVDSLLPLAGNSDVPVYFYRTGNTAGNTNKAPLAITAAATVATPTVTTTVTSETFAGGHVFTAAGDGFRQSTNPGDAGIYAAVAPSGGAPGYSGADIGKYIGTKYIFANGSEGANTAKLTDGAFSTTITLPAAQLDPNVEYSLYTWQSHTHSNTTQDTETPLDIDFDAVERYISTTELGVETATVVIGDDVVATATVEGATGSVEFFDGEASLGSADLVDGVASRTIEGLAVGTHSLTAVYGGNANYAKSTSSAQEVVVTKADGDVSLSLSRTSGIYGNIVNATANVAGTGAVAFLVDDKTVATAEIVEGVATAQLPRTIAAGTHSVVASYVGNDTTNAVDSAAVELTLAKATTAKVTVAGAKFKKNSYPVVTVKVSKLSNGFYPTGTLKVLVNGKVDRTVNLTEVRKGVYAVKLNKQSKAITVQASFKPDSASVTGNYSSKVSIKLK